MAREPYLGADRPDEIERYDDPGEAAKRKQQLPPRPGQRTPPMLTQKAAVPPPAAGSAPMPRRSHSPPPQELPPPTSAEYGSRVGELADARQRAQEAERHAAELRAALDRERRKNAPAVEPEPLPSLPPSKAEPDKVAIWIGRLVLWLWRKLGWGGILGILGLGSAVLGNDRVRTIWENLAAWREHQASEAEANKRRDERIQELEEVITCLRTQQGAALESLTPDPDRMGTAGKPRPYVDRCDELRARPRSGARSR